MRHCWEAALNGLIASRSAGLKLFGLVAVLVLPLLVLSYFMLGETKEDYIFTKSEIQGLDAADVLMPIALASASGDMSTAQREKFSASLKALPNELFAPSQVADLSGLLTIGNDNAVDILTASAKILRHVGTKSNLILDPFEETYFLANTALYEIPSLVQNYHAFYTQINNSLAFAGVSQVEMREIMLRLGRLDESLQRINAAVSNTVAATQNAEKYDIAKRLMTGLEQEIKATNHAIKTAQPGSETAALMELTFRSIDPQTQFKLESAVWTVTTTELRNALTERLLDIRKRYFALMTVAGMCLIFAAAGAYSMFRTTLKKLDVVEHAKQEAEKMSTQLSTMNNDMVDLNRQLSSKMSLLRNAQDDLVKKGRMEQLGQLTATIAHELRNPLGAVRTSSFLLERKLKGSGLDVDTQFKRINTGIVRCDNIITQLLDYSRTKQIIPKAAVFDDWLLNVVEEQAKILPANVQVECELGLQDMSVAFDASRLERAIVNMMTNASEAMTSVVTSGGVQSVASPKISIFTRKRNGCVEISVVDNGPGISIENLAKIREPLFTTKNFGTGLGIPAIEQIAAQHNGELIVESVLGHGASFTLRIPTQSEPEAIREVA
jgi:signal transduction histidine kinase